MSRRIPSSAIWKAALFAAVVGAGFAAARWTPLADFLTAEKISAFFETLRHSWWAPLLLIALYTFTSPLGVPVSVYMVACGAVFGFAAGSAYNLIGLTLGAASSYFLAKMLGRDLVVHLTGGGLRRVERAFDRGGFWPLVQIRFLPVPFAVVNFGAALAGVKAPLFLGASLVGLVPATLVHTYFMARLASGGDDWKLTAVWYVGVFGLFNLAISYPSIRRAWRRRKRYGDLVDQRRRRSGSA